MNYIKSPNLPENQVKIAIIDCLAGEYACELDRLGIKVIPTQRIDNIDVHISTHPDMQICHVGKSCFFTMNDTEEYYKEKIEELTGRTLCELFNNVYTYKIYEPQVSYPRDCKLNSVVTNRWVITHKDNDLYDHLDISLIKSNQGYAKCSTCVVSDEAIITADLGIAKSAVNFGLDVCIVTNNSIRLQGYSNGFIGGTCGKISKDTIAFFGNVKTHPDSDKIISFCKNHGVECISLSNSTLCDYGSLIPIIDE